MSTTRRSTVLTVRVPPEPLSRLTLPPGPRTGLKGVSQVMVDKIVSVPRAAIREEIILALVEKRIKQKGEGVVLF